LKFAISTNTGMHEMMKYVAK